MASSDALTVVAATLFRFCQPSVIVAQFIGIPSLLLYTAENLLSFLELYVSNRFGCLGLFVEVVEQWPATVLKIAVLIYYSTFHAENFACFFVLLNRFTCVAMPMRHDRIWKLLLPISIALIVLPSLIIAIVPNYHHKFFILRSNYTPRTFLVHYNSIPTLLFLSNSFLAAFFSLLFCAVCIALNAATFFAYRQKNGVISENVDVVRRTASNAYYNKSAQMALGAERRLTIYALATFASQAIVAAIMILFYLARFSSTQMDSVLHYLTAPVSDLCTVSVPAWLMLWANAELRDALRYPFAYRSRARTQTTAAAVAAAKSITSTTTFFHSTAKAATARRKF